jgi:hypothetical protein
LHSLNTSSLYRMSQYCMSADWLNFYVPFVWNSGFDAT